MVNFSSHQLSPSKTNLSFKDLNFLIAVVKFPDKIISAVESSIRFPPKQSIVTVQFETVKILSQAKIPKASIYTNTSITILPVDKENATLGMAD